MAFYFQLYWHFLLMVMFIIILAGMITFLIPRIPSVLVLAFSGLMGFIFIQQMFFVSKA